MPTYTAFDDFVTALSAASALDSTEVFPAVQSSASVKVTPAQIAACSAMTSAFVNIAAGTANTVQIIGEYMFTTDNELDYSASFSDGVMNSTVTFSELPANTVAIFAKISIADTAASTSFRYKRSSGATEEFFILGTWADGGTNQLWGTWWLPTGGNSIYATTIVADTTLTVKIIGYKTGE